jgi:2-dehydropantoate 2-reductase
MAAAVADPLTFGIVGVGSIGAYVGAVLDAAGHRVTFLVRRPEQARLLARTGLTATCGADYSIKLHIPPSRIEVGTDPSVLRRTDCVLVCTKRVANADVARLIAGNGAIPTLLLQNGLGAAAEVAANAAKPTVDDTSRSSPPHRCAEAPLIDCVVNFGSTWNEATSSVSLDESLDAAILLLDGAVDASAALATRMSSKFMTVKAAPNLIDYQSGKLLLNMTNAVNALSGLSVADMFLLHSEYRTVIAASVVEARRVILAHGATPRAPNPRNDLQLKIYPMLLRLPTCLFSLVAAKKLRGRGQSRTSMGQDLDLKCVRERRGDSGVRLCADMAQG